MKTNSPEAIVGWMVIISNLGLSWFLVKEKNLKQTPSEITRRGRERIRLNNLSAPQEKNFNSKKKN